MTLSSKEMGARLITEARTPGKLDNDEKHDFMAVGRWMRGAPVERPAKHEFDRVYSRLLDDGAPDKELATVERAATTGREEHEEHEERGVRRYRWLSSSATWAHAHRHKMGHHMKFCDANCRAQRASHYHVTGGRAHGGLSRREA